MRAFRVSPEKTSGKSIRTAVAVLQAGGIVAFPTETVYGLCVDPANEKAVRRLYELKGRDADKACAHLIRGRQDAEQLSGGLPPPAARLADAFWPGPLTLVVPGLEQATIGLRYSSVPLARALPRAFAGPLLQTSANRSGKPAALNPAGILKAFPEGVDLVLDAGRTPGGEASTVVDCNGPVFRILREAAITAEEIEAEAVERILIVCTGNICRSPTAEVMVRDRLAARLELSPSELSRHAFEVSSCGTQGWEGAPATAEAFRAAKTLGYDLNPHEGRLCSPEILGSSHRVWVMGHAHRDELRPYFQDRPEALELYDPTGEDVQDPYQQPRRIYKRVAKKLDEIAAARVNQLVPGVA
ncbi:MAG: L-threonylcarbamoyladenylate synthase [Planctomycetota bacterium]